MYGGQQQLQPPALPPHLSQQHQQQHHYYRRQQHYSTLPTRRPASCPEPLPRPLPCREPPPCPEPPPPPCREPPPCPEPPRPLPCFEPAPQQQESGVAYDRVRTYGPGCRRVSTSCSSRAASPMECSHGYQQILSGCDPLQQVRGSCPAQPSLPGRRSPSPPRCPVPSRAEAESKPKAAPGAKAAPGRQPCAAGHGGVAAGSRRSCPAERMLGTGFPVRWSRGRCGSPRPPPVAGVSPAEPFSTRPAGAGFFLWKSPFPSDRAEGPVPAPGGR